MDYSAPIHEADDAVGASPWGNSPTTSPRHSRPAFETLGEETPPFPINPSNANGLSPDPEAPESFQRPSTATTASGEGDNGDSETVNAPQTGSAFESQQSISEPAVAGASEEQTAQAEQAARDQEPRKPAKPQYRIQAKITGLERTGKKDPILRFDIHVRLS